MQKIILFLAISASALTLSACFFPDHSGVYQDQHNGREEQHHDDGYHDDHHDDHQDVDPRRQ